MTFKKTLIAACLTAACLTPVAASAAGVQIGLLTCHQSNRTNLVLYSQSSYDCVFRAASGARENFMGSIRKIGLDLTINKHETMAWYVFAPSSGANAGGLEGAYIGASADASVGAGVGAHVLVGGFDRSFALQPAVLSGQLGLGATAGVEQLRLSYIN